MANLIPKEFIFPSATAFTAMERLLQNAQPPLRDGGVQTAAFSTQVAFLIERKAKADALASGASAQGVSGLSAAIKLHRETEPFLTAMARLKALPPEATTPDIIVVALQSRQLLLLHHVMGKKDYSTVHEALRQIRPRCLAAFTPVNMAAMSRVLANALLPAEQVGADGSVALLEGMETFEYGRSFCQDLLHGSNWDAIDWIKELVLLPKAWQTGCPNLGPVRSNYEDVNMLRELCKPLRTLLHNVFLYQDDDRSLLAYIGKGIDILETYQFHPQASAQLRPAVAQLLKEAFINAGEVRARFWNSTDPAAIQPSHVTDPHSTGLQATWLKIESDLKYIETATALRKAVPAFFTQPTSRPSEAEPEAVPEQGEHPHPHAPPDS